MAQGSTRIGGWPLYDCIKAGELPKVSTRPSTTRRPPRSRQERRTSVALPSAPPRTAIAAARNFRFADLGGPTRPTKGAETTRPLRARQAVGRQRTGRQLHFGVKEFTTWAPSPTASWLASLTSAVGGTFFMFSSIMYVPPCWLPLMQIPTCTVVSVDSVVVGEDGLTHQPAVVEHLFPSASSCGAEVARPADAAMRLLKSPLLFEKKEHLPTAMVSLTPGVCSRRDR